MLNELRKPVPTALALVAAVGWLAAIYFVWSDVVLRDDSTAQISRLGEANAKLTADLDALRAASGTLEEARKQAADSQATGAKAAADRDAAAAQLGALRKDIEAAQRNLDDATAQAAARRAEGAQAVADQQDRLAALNAAADAATTQAKADLKAAQDRLAAMNADIAARTDALADLVRRRQAAEKALAEVGARAAASSPPPAPAAPAASQ